MPSVALRGVRNFALSGIDLDIDDGEILVLLGPNGSGKTTLLHVVAGLIPYEGRILFDGCSVDGIPTEKRNVGFLFQDLLLFPHMSVKENISFGLRMRGVSEDKIRERVGELARFLHLDHLLERFPHTLSGGEAQKVALARAVAPRPDVLLLDEPFSNLDLRTTKHLRLEFRGAIKKLGITSIFVTHNVMEAEEVGDRIAVIKDGRIEAVGRPGEVLFSGGEFLSFIGIPNVFPCDSLRYIGNGLSEVESRGMKIVVPYDGKSFEKVVIYAHEVFISKEVPPGPSVNRFRGKVVEKVVTDTSVRYVVDVGGGNLINAELPLRIASDETLEEGSDATVILKLRNLRVL